MILRPLRFLPVVLLLLASAAADSASAQPLVINELMQSNVDAVWDDRCELPDSWVELYNRSSRPVSLANYKIGTHVDAQGRPVGAWQLPASVMVPPHGYQLIYCDKGADSLHTDFRLEPERGCVVYLFRDGVVDHSASLTDTLRRQPAPNIAYGRRSDGSRRWGYCSHPTPGAKNAGIVTSGCRLLPSPLFSEPGRVFSGSDSIVLTLSLPDNCPEGSRIYYTTNGQEPSEEAACYTAPISITQSTVVRAVLVCSGWLSPRSTTHSYIFTPRRLSLPVVSIATDDSYLLHPRRGIFANNTSDRYSHKNWRRPVNMEYFEIPGSTSRLNQLCEMRVGGGATRENSRKTLILFAHRRFGTKRFDHEFFPDQKPGRNRFKSIVLRNAGNDFDYLYMRDALAQRSMAMHTDLDWQAWQPTIVYINGRYYGILNLRERGEEDNIYTNYDGLEDIDLFENWDNLKAGDTLQLKRFTEFYTSGPHTMAEYEQWMDCDEFINLMVMNLFYNNLDFPGNNIVMWRPRTEGGRWRWIAKDADHTMGIYGIAPDYPILQWFYTPHFDPQWDWSANGRPYTLLFRQLMSDLNFRNRFLERCAIYTGDFLNGAAFRRLHQAMRQTIANEMRFYGPLIDCPPDVYSDEAECVDQWVDQRTNLFISQLADFYHTSRPVPLTVNTRAGNHSTVRITFNDHPLSEARFDGRYFSHHPIRLAAQTADTTLTVAGWRIERTDSTQVAREDRPGSCLTLTMPCCQRLSIEPLVAPVATP